MSNGGTDDVDAIDEEPIWASGEAVDAPNPAPASSAPEAQPFLPRTTWAVLGAILLIGFIWVLIAASTSDSSSNGSGPLYGSATCTTDGSEAGDLRAATVTVSEGDDIVITLEANSEVPVSDEIPGSAEVGYTFYGDSGNWWLRIYNPILGGWQAYAQGDVAGAAPADHDPSDFTGDAYVGDDQAVTVDGNTLTVRWPYGSFLDARTRSGDPLTLDGWSAEAQFSDASCPPSGYGTFPVP